MLIKRIFDILDYYNANFPDKKDALAGKKDGKWVKYSTKEYINLSYKFAAGLLAKGYTKNTKIATIFSNNRPEWNFTDMGLMLSGMIHVPIYPTISEEEYTHILNHSESKVLIIYDEQLLKKIKPILNKTQISEVYSVKKIKGVKRWAEIIETGEKEIENQRRKIEEIKNSIKPDDMLTIIYTSGTTGKPKGVMLSHKNLISNFLTTSKLLPINNTGRALSFLPLCHVYERMIIYVFQYKGLSIYYAENMGTIANDIKEIKPNTFNTVPRLLETIYDKIMAKGKNLPH